MAEKRIDEISAARKRTALLALAADSGEKAGACLTPAAMAAFLDGSCSSEEKEAALRHIGLCQRCYGQWLTLVELQMENSRTYQKKERRPFFLRPANLAAIASAMAAMVCIGVFLDVNPFNYRIDRQTLPPVTTVKKKLPMAPAPAPVVQNKMATDTAASPAPPQIQEKPPVPSPRTADAELAAGAAAPREMRLEGLREQATPPGSFLQWRKELIAVCREKNPENLDRGHLDQLFREGKRRMPTWRHEPWPSADRPLQLLLLGVLDQAKSEEQLLGRCQEILTEIERIAK